MKLLRGLLLALVLLGGAAPAAAQNLTAADVDLVLSRAVQEANALGVNVTAAVVDRVGNVLGVYRTGGAVTFTISSGAGIPLQNGLEQVNVINTEYAAIAKAITGAYLSSGGNAFTTRTASQIVQRHFNPGETNQAGGPLFGVQFSQLPCSDLVGTIGGAALGIGPRRSPLGLSADPGGLPLYKGQSVVGGVGVISDRLYSLDRNIQDYDRDNDERIAIAAQTGYAPPEEILAYRIAVDGRLLRYADVDQDFLASNPAAAPAAPAGGAFVNVAGYFTAGASRAGQTYGTNASGIRADNGANYAGLPAFVLDDGAGTNRFPPTASAAGSLAAGDRLTAAEVRTIMREALFVAYRARAQIRRPLGSFAEVTISIVDVESNILAIARTADAPVFGIDVSLQKARSAAFLSTTTAAGELTAAPNTNAYTVAGLTIPGVARYVTAARSFSGNSNFFADGVAFSSRATGNIARPNYPDGIVSNSNGPLSLPVGNWSPFNTGLQLDLVIPDIVARLDGSTPNASGCSVGNAVDGTLAANSPTLPRSGGTGPTRLANGLQIFAGGVPIYRNNTLVGAIGVSGDGIDQDDMIAFLGLANGSAATGNGLGNAPQSIRSDSRVIRGIAPRFVSCPVKPFNYSRQQNACAGR